MKLSLWLVAILYVQTVYSPLNAQPVKTTTEKADEYLLSAHQVYQFNGVALIAHKGNVLLHKAYGVRNAVTKAPNDTTTRFPILSITKSFTAALILKLQEQGKLSVQDKLSHYFPQFPNGDKISLHHLLTHASGLFNYTELIDEGDSAIVCHPVPRQRLLDIISNKPLAFEPGKQFSYNNSGYFLLGLVIEKVTGKPYEQVMREMIFQPLGMSHSGFDFINLPAQSRAFGYDTLTADYYSPYPHPDSTVLFAAGGIYSTTSDMLRWGQAVAEKRLLSAKSWEQAFTPRLDGYGYGWMIETFGGKRCLRHSGGYPGFKAEFVYYPNEELTLILLNNFGTYADSLYPIVMGLSAIVFDKPYDLWAPRQEVAIAANILRQYVGRYVYVKDSQIITDMVLKNGQLHGLGHSKIQIPEYALYPSGQDQFQLRVNNSRVTFKRDASDQVIGCTIRENGQDYEWKKVN